MKKNNNKLLMIIIIVVILIIIIIGMILVKLKDSSNNVDDIYQEYFNHGEEEKNDSIELLTNTNTFYTVESCINTYLVNKSETDKVKINTAIKMWYIDINDNISVYYVYTKVRDKYTFDISNEQDIYYTIALDKKNKTFSVLKITDKYSEEELGKISTYNIHEIKNEEINEYTDIIIYNEDIIKKYFDEYLKNVLYKTETAYEMVDTEYRNKKFKDIGSFKEYVDNNRNNLMNTILVKYSKEQFDDYTKYTVIDNYNNSYIIKENSVMNFTIMLDNYTIETDEFDYEYENASDEKKIATNVDKIFKMINNKEYKNIYDNYINDEFKNNYFSNYNDFNKFMKEKFFDYNYLGRTSLNKQNGYYIANINYKDGLSSAAEERNIDIIFKINQNTDFEISFRME